jgi:hypothetical protein
MRTTRPLALLAGLVLFIAACAGDDGGTAADGTTTTTEADGDRQPMEIVSEAAENTLDEGSAMVTLTISGPASGADDLAGEAGTGTNGNEAVLEIEDDFDEDRRAFTSSDAGATGDPLIIVDGSEAYIQQSMAGGTTGETDEEATWLRFDLDDAADEDDLTIEGLPEGFPFRESRQILEVLRDVDGEAREMTGTTDTTGTDEDDLDVSPTTTPQDLDPPADVDDDANGDDDAATTTTDDDDTNGDDTTTTTNGADDGTTTTTDDDDATTTGTTGDTRYEVTIDLEGNGNRAIDGDADGFLERLAEQTGMSELVVEVTIGADDVITEVSYELETGTAGTTGTTGTDADDTTTTTADDDTNGTDDGTDAGGTTTTTTDTDPTDNGTTGTTGTTGQDVTTVTIAYDQLGMEVDITVPDDDQVTDLDVDELRQAFTGMTGTGGTGTGTTGDDDIDVSPTTTPQTLDPPADVDGDDGAGTDEDDTTTTDDDDS